MEKENIQFKKVVSFRLPDSLGNKLEIICRKKGLTKSEVVREFVGKLINNEKLFT